MNHDLHTEQPLGGLRGKIVLAVFLAIGAFFLLTEHRAHVFGALPYLLLLACPLMHLFHHGGHGGHRGHQHGSRRPETDATGRSERTDES